MADSLTIASCCLFVSLDDFAFSLFALLSAYAVIFRHCVDFFPLRRLKLMEIVENALDV